jgi:hypothetical protein
MENKTVLHVEQAPIRPPVEPSFETEKPLFETEKPLFETENMLFETEN